MTPTTLSLRWLAAEGWTADVVERRTTSNLTHDLFGCWDIIAVKAGETMAVQCTTNSNVAARVRKITDSPLLAAVREAGWVLEVHGWRSKAGVNTLRRVEIS